METVIKILGGIDGDVWALLGLGAVWLYRKIRGESTADIKARLWPALDGVAWKLAGNDFVVAIVRQKLEHAAIEGLERLGLKRNRIANAIIAELVERGVTEVRQRVQRRKELEAQISALAGRAAKVRDAFSPPVEPTVPKLEMDVEVVQP
jgi:hypothetical protein